MWNDLGFEKIIIKNYKEQKQKEGNVIPKATYEKHAHFFNLSSRYGPTISLSINVVVKRSSSNLKQENK